MKSFAFIYILYLLAVSIVPCSDAYSKCTPSKYQIVTTVDHSHKAGHQDICGPFCSCACCGTTANFAFQPLKINEVRLPDAKAQKFPAREFFFISGYYGNIWQPPRLS